MSTSAGRNVQRVCVASDAVWGSSIIRIFNFFQAEDGGGNNDSSIDDE